MKPTIKSTFIATTLCALMLGLSGCGSVAYYSQSVLGHSRLMLARTPLDKALIDADEELRAKLNLARELKHFAVTELGLPDGKSYNSYVALEREFPVWTVVAAPEFSLQAKQWCYPVIGCASYRGYFSESAANQYANRLHTKGYETTVAGAPAYSTLGWFADPLLPSMMRYGDVSFAETLFHELAHQVLYINGDSAFNEAFATVVGEQGAVRWLLQNRPEGLNAYKARLNAKDQFNALFKAFKSELSGLYAQEDMSLAQKQQSKEIAFADFKQRYIRLREERWQGRGWYDRWFEIELNNARLASLSTYRDQVPELEQLLIECGDDLSEFYATVSKAAKIDHKVQIPKACI